MGSQDLTDKLGAVAAIDELLETASSQSEAIRIRFSKALSAALRANTEYELLEKVRKGW